MMPRYPIIFGKRSWPAYVPEKLGWGTRVCGVLVLAEVVGLALLASVGRAEAPSLDTVGQDDWPRGGWPAALAALEGPLSPLERRLLDDGTDGRWDAHSLLEAALVASGVDRDDRLVGYRRQAAELLAELARSDLSEEPRRRTEQVFEFLHRRVLRGRYRLDATDLTWTFDHGDYNCVSASVLFNHFAAGVGLRVSGLERASHATSRVFLGQGILDLETTYAGWFRLVGQKQHPSDASHEVSDVALVATIYYNRGVERLERQEYAEALSANAKALRLDPRRTAARGNLLASLNNWAIALSVAGRYAEAADRLRQGLALEPSYPPFTANFVHVHRQWVHALCQEGRFQEAHKVHQAASVARPTEL